MQNLIIWRHAEAELESDSGHDHDRALTKRGRKDAAKMAKWLYKHLPKSTKILCSPACRCLQTVQALQDLNPLEINITASLSIESNVEHILQAAGNQDKDSTETILLVGHQPNLGLLISKLLGLHESASVVKKGAVWWLTQRQVNGLAHYYVSAVKQPRLD